jgi:hypothetical protein
MEDESAAPADDTSGTSGAVPSIARTSRSPLARAVASLIVVAVVVAVVWSAVIEVGTIRSAVASKSVRFWDVDAAYWSCLDAQVQSAVPPGQTVWVSSTSPNAPTNFEVLWKATAGYRPLTNGQQGVTNLHLVDAAKGQACLGVEVKAVSPAGVVTYGTGSIPQVDWARWKSLHSPHRSP